MITVVNLDDPGEGFNDPTMAVPVGGNPGVTIGQQRLIAFQHAANIWASLITSPVEIRVEGKFDPLSCSANSAVLGSAGPNSSHRNFPGAPVPSTWYVQALANSLFGGDLSPGSNDIGASFSSTIGTPGCLQNSGWYYGLDASPPAGKIDFVTVLLHELGHGLGFLSLVSLSTGQKRNGFDDAYMRFLEDHSTSKLYPQMTDEERLAASINTGNLHWTGPNVVAGSGGLTAGRHPSGHVRMYAPNPAQSGSSVSHYDTALSPNELMEPSYTGPRHDVGLTLELFADLGWNVSSVPLLPEVTIAATDHTATEQGPTTGSLTVSRTGSTMGSLAVLYSTGGTAAAGSDYQTLSGSVMIPIGQSSATITITPIDDAVVGEANETVIATLTADAAYTIGAQNNATVTITANAPAPTDFDGDGLSDVVVFRGGAWLFHDFASGAQDSGVWTGSGPGCTPVAMDYDGDGMADFTQFCNGAWHFYNFDGSYLKGIWTGGVAGDLPVPADYDGDGKSDVVVYRGGAWLFFNFTTGAFDAAKSTWTGGGGGCIPAPMDYDGDGTADFTQLCNGAWHFYNDNGSYNKGIWTGGVAGDLPVPADYDGNGTDDVVVFRGGAWLFFDFATGAFDGTKSTWTGAPAHFTGGTSLPAPLDYDGDGKADFSVYSGGPWHFYNSNGTYNKGVSTAGVAGDRALSRRLLP